MEVNVYMKKYNFYYDETEHSRRITLNTINSSNYYDNFITAIVGWNIENEAEIFERYAKFEDKYKSRKTNGELKSTTLTKKIFRYGFASLNKDNIEFIDDFLSFFDENMIILICINSKLEYIIHQLFCNYQNKLENKVYVSMDSLKYSIVKALLVYRPKEIFECIYADSTQLIPLLKDFFRDRIEQNMLNLSLKKRENETFEEILKYLDNVQKLKTINWNYDSAFIEFKKYLQINAIDDYSLILDKEGENGNTLTAALEAGLKNVSENDSKYSCGIRIADMLAGLVSRLLKSLNTSFEYNSVEEQTQKKLLDNKWLELSDSQLNLYKKMHKIFVKINEFQCASFFMQYKEDWILLNSLLKYMNSFDSAKDIRERDLDSLVKNFGYYVCQAVINYFNYPILKFDAGKCECEVCEIGFKEDMPIIVSSKNICYSLPLEFTEKVESFIKLYPSQFNPPVNILFSYNENGCDLNIL